MRFLIFGLILVAGPLAALAESADYTFVPPPAKATTTASGPLPASALSKALQAPFPRYTVDTYAGQAETLRKSQTMPSLQVAKGIDLDWTDQPFFEEPVLRDSAYHWQASIQSVDATALRVKVDLSTLRSDESLWIVDPTGTRPFGPFTAADADPAAGFRWLPTVMGDECVLWVKSESADTPRITALGLSHFYDSPATTKGSMPCPLPADCITDTSLQEISTGIGRLSVTDDRGNSALCSGALINNATTEALEAYFLTADHCFQDFPGTIFASALEVIWDFRASGCDGGEPSTAILNTLPRSTGAAFLGNSATIDGMLLQLAAVPVGTRGRAYLGWDTRTPTAGEAVVCLHHPSGDPMKESIGTVTRTGVNSSFGENQTTLSWTEGITEGGSSGSPSLFSATNFRIFGMLSNGNFQSCSSAAARLDQYSSFRDFFDQIGGFLVDATPPSAGRSAYTTAGTGGGTPTTVRGCIMEGAARRNVAGDLLVSGLALLTLLGLAKFRALPPR